MLASLTVQERQAKLTQTPSLLILVRKPWWEPPSHGDVPEHLLADEHHQGLDGQKVYIATTVGNGCCLGAEPAKAAGSDKLKVAYQVFKDEACDVSPEYRSQDRHHRWLEGDASGLEDAVYEGRHPVCFLTAGSRSATGPTPQRGVRRSLPAGLGYLSRAPDGVLHNACARSASGRPDTSQGSSWRRSWTCVASATAGRLPTATPAATASNMLDRLMRGMNRYFDQGQRLHGSLEACRLALSCLGLVVQLHALAPGGGGGKLKAGGAPPNDLTSAIK